MAQRRGIRERLGRLFALQLAVIGIATLVGIYLTQVIVEDLLTRQALNAESEHFWQLFDLNPDVPLPNTANMQGYLAELNQPFAAPAQISDFPDGYHRAHLDGSSVLLHVSQQGDRRLMLAFEGDRVSDLAFYFGVLPLSVVLLMIYGLLFLAYRWAQQAVSPLEQLAQRLEHADLDRTGRTELELDDIAAQADSEVHAMVEALQHFIDRLDRAVERERNFTRDAGHELRTPVAVLKGTLDLMEQTPDRPAQDQRGLARMRRTVDGMALLLESLLILAREEIDELPTDTIDVAALVERQIADLQGLATEKKNLLFAVPHSPLEVQCPGKLLEIVLINLIRNALIYTDGGEVRVEILADRVVVADTGPGMTPAQLDRATEPFYRADDSRGGAVSGHGLGLSIVQRIVSLLGWRLSLDSEIGAGTRVSVSIR